MRFFRTAILYCIFGGGHLHSEVVATPAEFLALTPAQIAAIKEIIGAYGEYSSIRGTKLSELQEELRDWTNRSPLVPAELGLRYAEIEQVRRQVLAEYDRALERIRMVLNDDQRRRVQTVVRAQQLSETTGSG